MIAFSVSSDIRYARKYQISSSHFWWAHTSSVMWFALMTTILSTRPSDGNFVQSGCIAVLSACCSNAWLIQSSKSPPFRLELCMQMQTSMRLLIKRARNAFLFLAQNVKTPVAPNNGTQKCKLVFAVRWPERSTKFMNVLPLRVRQRKPKCKKSHCRLHVGQVKFISLSNRIPNEANTNETNDGIKGQSKHVCKCRAPVDARRRPPATCDSEIEDALTRSGARCTRETRGKQFHM